MAHPVSQSMEVTTHPPEMIFWQFTSVAGCVWTFLLLHFECMSDFWPDLNSPLEHLMKFVLYHFHTKS